MIRKCAVKGQFYPGNVDELKTMLSEYGKSETIVNCQTVIVPHAGYIFSGECAYKAISAMDFDSFDRLVIIGPSHLSSVQGVSVFMGEEFESVAGNQKIDREYCEILGKDLKLEHISNAHLEHSTEVQIPIIQNIVPDMPIVECVYGGDVVEVLFLLLAYLQGDERTGVILSTDLSHFHTDEEARKIDAIAVEAVQSVDAGKLQGAEACGMLGLVALLAAYEDYKALNVVYGTSADGSFGNSDEVVGYLSACLVKK